MRILGLDPSLSSTGWGIVEVENNRLRYVADGFIKTDPKLPIYDRLAVIHRALNEVIETYHPQEAAIEQVFLNENPTSTIKLGMARGVVIRRRHCLEFRFANMNRPKSKKRWSG